MFYDLHTTERNKLLTLPETGMGYQIIEASIQGSYSKYKYLVYNCELVLDFDSSFIRNKIEVFQLGYLKSLNKAQFISLDTNTIKVYTKSQALDYIKGFFQIKLMSEADKKEKKRQVGGKAAIDSEKEYADGKEIFVRVSAFENDRRVDLVNKKLLDGSFTTTEEDYNNCVKYSDDPVDRYALPNDDKIEWAFYFKPVSKDILQRGIVQPAFDHVGGGIEVYFEKGTSNDTYLNKTKYGV